MKKYILNLLTILVVLSSCQKEDDLLQPIPTPPTTQINNIVNTDTTVTLNGDTIIVQALEEDFLIDNNTTNTSTSFIGEGKTWKITESQFIMNCSELTTHHKDTSYSFTTNPYSLNSASTISFNDDPYNLGEDIMTVNVYLRNVGTQLAPTHAVDMEPKWLTYYIDSYSYEANKLSMDLRVIWCNGQTIEWPVVMDVTEYSDGTIRLEITNNGHLPFPHVAQPGVTWDSYLSLLLEEI